MEPYYSGGVSQRSLQGESGIEESFENIKKGNDELVELEEGNENDVQGQNCSTNKEIIFNTLDQIVDIPDLPLLTPSSEESTEPEHVLPQVTSQPILNESNMIPHVPIENIAPRYLQIINKGVPKK